MTATDTKARPAAESSPNPASPVAEQRRTRARNNFWVRRARQALVALVLLGLAGVAALALMPQPVPVDKAKVSRGSLTVTIQETGVTRVKDRFVVSAPVSGTLSRIVLDPGDKVSEGDILAEIAPAQSPLLDQRARAQAEAQLGAAVSALGQARAQQTRAKNAHELSEREFERVKSLWVSGAVTPQQFEQAQFEARMRGEEVSSAEFARKVAQEQVRSARAMLDPSSGDPRKRHVDVLSPVSGGVLRVHQKSAGVVPAGTPLLEIGDPAALEIVVDLLTTDAVHVKSGTPVLITGWGTERELKGRVRRIEPSGFTRLSALGVDEQRVNVIIALTEPRSRWTELADSYHVEARIVLWEGKNLLKAPYGAVFRHGDGWAAYRIDSGKAWLTPVRIGHRSDTEVQILSGLSEGTVVAVHAGDRVKDGTRVEAR